MILVLFGFLGGVGGAWVASAIDMKAEPGLLCILVGVVVGVVVGARLRRRSSS